MEDEVVDILVSFLGDYSKKSGEWYSFNCPCCAENDGGYVDDKYNLEVTIDLDSRGCGGYHCWKCGEIMNTKGQLTKLVRKYAPKSTYSDFAKLVSEYRHSKNYELFHNNDKIVDEFEELTTIHLPNGFKKLNINDKDCAEAYDYMKSRGITDKIIETYNIGYIANNTNSYNLKKRVYIPSYDDFDNLTYWVGRDYTRKNLQKTTNPKVSKTKIIFNEGMINWYEPITLVEGPFDHIVTPNSIPLLGKTLTEEYLLYEMLMKKARCDIRIFLDDDALTDAYKIYRTLNKDVLKDKIRLVETPEGYDPSQIFEEFGASGIIELLCGARKISEYELINN